MNDNVLVKVIRGGLNESNHCGHAVVVDAGGRVRAWYGDQQRLTLSRSSLKPIQALAVVSSGAADRFQFSDRQLAVMCGSHYGQVEHQQAVTDILRAIGRKAADLECGVHDPIDPCAREELVKSHGQASPVHNNCSGKHAGMLAVAEALAVDPAGYIECTHQVQLLIADIVAAMAGVEPETLMSAVDGCGVPSYALPLWRIAYLFARMSAPELCPTGLSAAAKRIAAAMVNQPLMVAGNGAFDTELMRVGRGRFAAKSGADGVHCVCARERNLGVVVKVEDGSRRAVAPAMMAALDQLGLLTDDDKRELERFVRPVLKNNRGNQVGELVAAWSMEEAGN